MDAQKGNPDIDNLDFARVDLARLRRQGVGVKVCVHRQENGMCVRVLFEHAEK